MKRIRHQSDEWKKQREVGRDEQESGKAIHHEARTVSV
jgi:hypothetical protein